MPNLETPDELADHIADLAGIYGAHGEEETSTCTDAKPCRVCFVSGMTDRIREAVRNEALLTKDRAAGRKEG